MKPKDTTYTLPEQDFGKISTSAIDEQRACITVSKFANDRHEEELFLNILGLHPDEEIQKLLRKE